MRLQQKALALALPAALVGGVLIAFVSRRATESVMISEAARRALPQAEELAQSMSSEVASGDEKLLLPRAQAARNASGAAYAAVLSSGGIVLAHTSVLERGRRRDDPAARRALAASASSAEEVEEEGQRRLFLGVPIWRVEEEVLLSGKDRTREGTLLLSLPLDATLASARRAGTQGVVLVMIFCAAGLAGMLLLLRHILVHLGAVADATRHVAAGDYDVLIPAGSSDEVGDLARAFNDMNARLSRTAVSRDLLKETLEASGDGILVVTGGRTIVVFNRRFLEMWGLTAEAVEAADYRRLTDLLAPKMADPAGFVERSDLNAEEYAAAERRDVLRLNDGRVIERISRPYRQERAAVGRTLSFHELTAFLAAERAKGQFMAAMSHELRSPLNAVIGAAELLRGTALDAGQEESVSMLTRGATRLLALIDDVLDFSKIDAQRMTIERVYLRPADALADAAALVATAAAQKGVILTVDAAGAAGLGVLGDLTRLSQILLNLLSNAVKFTEKGEVTASLRASPRDDGTLALEFSVRDSGIGITPEQGQRLFEPFAQADGSTARRYGGTGLGLAISKSLASLMGGALGYESEPGRGSRFWLKVALERADAPAAEAAAPGRPPTARPRDRQRVLVVDDIELNRQLLVRQLERLGCPADVAQGGEEALALQRRGAYGLILMDCQMPGMDGFAAAAAVRREEEGSRRTPIVALTANTSDADQRRCLDAGMDGFLSKPATLESLFEALERWDDPFDAVALKSFLETMDGAAEPGRVFASFTDGAAKHLAAARAALAAGDRVLAARKAHALKGTCAVVGARGLRELARRLETEAKSGADGLGSLLDQAEEELDRVKMYNKEREQDRL